jgi:hypothetical protein
MTTGDGIDALLRAARRVADGEPLTGDLLTQEGVPARLRLVLAAVALTAADLPTSKRAIVDAAPAAWSATYRNHSALLDDVKTLMPSLVAAQLEALGAMPTSADLRTQLDQANASVDRERKRVQHLEEELRQLREYALQLHRKLKPEYDAMMAERRQKVRQLRPVSDDGPAGADEP